LNAGSGEGGPYDECIEANNGAFTMLNHRTNLIAAAALAGLLATTIAPAPLFAEESKEKPHIDLAFCIDTTGSMQGEIENVKAKTKELVAKLAGGKPSPVIRVGLVAFRDHGDAYVTKVFPFSEDIDKVVKDISSLKADGGGDAPEAVNEALHASVNGLKWSEDKKTLKMLFLIGDAGPNHYAHDFDYKTEAKSAIAHGIQINTLGCQGLEGFAEQQGVGVFKEIAKLADGKYESLSYHETVIGADGKPEDVVASGGKVYRMKSKTADWKAGAGALSARGDAEVVTAAAPMAIPAGRTRGLMMSTGAMAGGAADGFASLDAPAYVGIAGGARRGGAIVRDYAAASAPSSHGVALEAASVSRKENNLADVIFAATKDAAAKKLNVDFKER
jgi:Mg-chelatase subunit ChlD